MYKIKGGITAPLGFKQAAVNSGIKKKKLDLALIYSQRPAIASGVFTTNKFKAAPVLLCKDRLKAKYHRAVIINSGNANCLTGKKGLDDAKDITGWLALLLGVKKDEVLACSTGIIGKRLPVKKIINGLAGLVKALSKNRLGIAAKAIMTTDTFKKEVSLGFKVGKIEVRLGGIAKGAGMIAPNLATMISVITTDAKISKGLLKRALKEAVDTSFNCVSVDGNMSTNDTVLVFANGASGVDVDSAKIVYKKFVAALYIICLELAKMIARDGEGATKFIEIEVKNARDKADAKRVALGIANSPLFKTMCYGENPNFGRIAASSGAASRTLRPDRVDIYMNNLKVVKNGLALYNKIPQRLFKQKNIGILVDLNSGKAGARIFTCDLSPAYVKINAEYS